MSNEFFKKGAEAELSRTLFDSVPALSKKRIVKGYRNPLLDAEIRKMRVRVEAKLLKEASSAVNVPKILVLDEAGAEIIMEFIPGAVLKDSLSAFPDLCIEAGKRIRALHDIGIIHGDLTTSNIIVADTANSQELKDRVKSKGLLFFVDFGLGFFSKKLEDRAVDLVVFKKTFNATHSGVKNGWNLVMRGYAPSKELSQRMDAIEKRARYH